MSSYLHHALLIGGAFMAGLGLDIQSSGLFYAGLMSLGCGIFRGVYRL